VHREKTCAAYPSDHNSALNGVAHGQQHALELTELFDAFGAELPADARILVAAERYAWVDSLTAAPITAARCAGGVAGHGLRATAKAVRAAATAASTSAFAASGTFPTYAPVAGEWTAMTSPVDGSTHFPPMNSLSYSVVELLIRGSCPYQIHC
jgi:hypothetical protein